MRPILCLLLAVFCSVGHAAQFRGKVVSPDGAPVAGATLWVGERGLLAYSEKDGTMRRLTTGGDGAFAFETKDAPGTTPNIPQAPSFAFARVQAEKFALCDLVLISGDNTIKLQAAKGVHGIVQDAKRTRVADARIVVLKAIGGKNLNKEASISGSRAGNGRLDGFSEAAWAAALPVVETRSDAIGKWRLGNINGGIIALRDPRFADTRMVAAIPGIPGIASDKDVVTIVARPAADLQGRILTPDGKPLSGAFVVDSSGWLKPPVRTDATGAFILNGLEPGRALIQAYTPNDQWVIPHLQIPALAAEKVNQALEWKATRGIEFTGQIVDGKSGAPVAGAKVDSAALTLQRTDAGGHFRLRVAPGLISLSITHPDFVELTVAAEDTGEVPTINAGRIALERPLFLRGRLTGDYGQPVKQGTLLVTTESKFVTVGKQINRPSIKSFSISQQQTGPDGTFEIRLAQGSHKLSADGQQWELLPRPEVMVELDEKTAPLQLRAKSLATPILAAQKATGRVLTEDGKVLPDVTVAVKIERPRQHLSGGGFTRPIDEEIGVTDAQGRYSIEIPGDTLSLKVREVANGKYLLRKAGEAKPGRDLLNMPAWNLSNTVAAAFTSISGTVRDLKGTPVAGALVASPDSTTFAPVKTDEQGRFSLQNIGGNDAVVFAAQGRDFARGTVKNGVVELQLSPPGVLVEPMRRHFFEQFRAGWSGTPHQYWPVLGGERMLALGLHMDGALANGESDLNAADWSKAGGQTVTMLQYAAHQDPAWLREHGAALLAKIGPPKDGAERWGVEFEIARAQAFGNAAERAVAKQWLDAAVQRALGTKDKPGEISVSAWRWFRLAGLAGALRDPRTKEFTLTALNLAEQAGKKAISNQAWEWGRELGVGGPAPMALLEQEWPLPGQGAALAGAATAVMPFDLTLARTYLEKLKTLENDPAYKKSIAEAETELNGLYKSSHVESNLLRWQAEVNPAGALRTLEEQKGEFNQEGRRLEIVSSAWRKKEYAVMERALRPYLEKEWPYYGAPTQYAAMSEHFDKNFAASLWRKVDERMKVIFEKNAQAQNHMDYIAVADYAFYRAPLEPELSRLRLEVTWSHSRLVYADDPDQYYDQAHGKLIGAMMALDPVRSLGMLGDIKGLSASEARLRLAAYFLADDSGRLLLQSTH